jgi:protein-S-isoprenylcysteine O-methyltransferase Ste14
MTTPDIPAGKPSKTASVPRWLALVLGLIAWLVGVPLAHAGVPWALSLVGHRYGWTDGNPAVWNLLGLIPVLIGSSCLIWVMAIGFAHAAEMPDSVDLDWSPKVFLVRGPYALSRNPMYVAELALWLGWSVFYGSLAVFTGCLVLGAMMTVVVQREERDLEARFGAAYREYKTTVPRWLGTTLR